MCIRDRECGAKQASFGTAEEALVWGVWREARRGEHEEAREGVIFTLKRSIGVNFTLISRIVKITLTHGAAFTDTYHFCTYCTGMY